MKILLLTDGIYPYVVGGMQKHSFYLAKFLALRGHQVTLAHCVPAGKHLPTEEEVKNVMGLPEEIALQCVCMHFPRAGWLPGHYLKESYLHSHQLFDRFKSALSSFDFIYAKGFSAWYFLKRKARGYVMPPVGVKFHGYEMYQAAATTRSRLEHALLRGPVKWNNLHADLVFSYGGKITGLIEQLGVAPHAIAEVPTGIESAWFSGIRKPATTPVKFVFVGRDERRKGMPELIEVLREPGFDSPFTFDFIGPVNASSRVNRPHITYHGIVTTQRSLQALLDQCHVLVVPSWSEGMPNVIMEGMARGLAIIATDVGAVSALVSAENGWLIQPGSVSALRDAIAQAAALRPEDLDRIRAASAVRVRQFAWEEVVKQVEAAVAAVLAVTSGN
jgi:glycosyltransferase involved in cell wall biosynthesis